jgi:RNA polymerase sigma factor (sigma-70 family)
MNINEIMLNKELRELLKDSIRKSYYRYKLGFIIDMEDFEQEVYIYLIPRLKNFDENKSSINTYLPMVVMSCAKNCIKLANGQSKVFSKLDFNNSLLSLDYEYNSEVNEGTKLTDGIGEATNDLSDKIIIDEILSVCELTEKQKIVISLMREGFTITDIAKMLSKSSACINITFQRAKEKIVKKYAL